MARVFISYRRIDSKWAVGRLYDRLSEVLNQKNLFLDVSDIEPGEDYVEKIEAIVGSCDVLLVVMGPDWLMARDSAGRRRLDDPKDWVRVEISTALSRGIRVIPILIDEAQMPDRHVLPDELTGLCRRNAKLVSFTHFHADLDSLLRVLDKVLRPSTEPTAKPIEPEPEVREPAAKETATNETVNSSSPKEDKRPELPLTICLETKGGVATPLIYRGTQLPTEESQIFSTAEDNQKAVTVILVWGERANAEDNLALGRFNLEDIPPAKSGIPQIEVSTNVDTNLIMTVTAKDKGSGRIEILDAIDLSRVEIPEDMQKEALEEPRRKESHRDVGDIFEAFGSIFGASQAKTSKRKNTRAPKANEETCSRWGGKGRIIQSAGIFRLETTCPQCGGEGVVPRTSDWDRKGTGKGDDRKR